MLPLKELTYLALDCQTTGNNTQKDHILELGWCMFTVSENETPHASQTLIIHPPQDISVPKRIQKLTGIEDADMTRAVPLDDAIQALTACATAVAQKNGLLLCPTIIHYARFEMGFLRHAQKRIQCSEKIPLDVICTHKIAARLLPHLPRKGLRAVAGYLGHSVPKEKRCNGHLAATRWIWRQLVKYLADQAGIHTLNQIHCWLDTPVKSDVTKYYPMPEGIRQSMPAGPGVYAFKRDNNDLLYIGKATNLKQRVNSYFHQSRRHPEHILEMLTQAKDLSINPTDTALEAALLESDTIKQANPPYNIALTSGHRDIFYLSRNFETNARAIHATCPLGPVPSADCFTAAHALGRRLLSLDGEADSCTVMAMPMVYCPDNATFDAGLSLFGQTARHVFEQMPIGRAVRQIGHESWRKKMKEKEQADNTDATDTHGSDEAVEFIWTPERVAGHLESICRRCGFLLRRARWFHILAHAQVVWQKKANDVKRCHLLLLKQGVVVAHMRGPCEPSPHMPYTGVEIGAKHKAMDLETYDRLRVLTTEIRRLVAEERMVFVQLGWRARLYPPQLAQLLRWI